jgi:anti-sigma factor RsiW
MNSPNSPTDHDFTDPAGFDESWLSAFLDNELDAAQRAAVEAKLQADPHAAEMLEDLKRIRELIGRLPAWEGTNSTFNLQLLNNNNNNNNNNNADAVVAADTTRVSETATAPQPTWQHRRWSALAALAAGLIGLLLYAGNYLNRPEERSLALQRNETEAREALATDAPQRLAPSAMPAPLAAPLHSPATTAGQPASELLDHLARNTPEAEAPPLTRNFSSDGLTPKGAQPASPEPLSVTELSVTELSDAQLSYAAPENARRRRTDSLSNANSGDALAEAADKPISDMGARGVMRGSMGGMDGMGGMGGMDGMGGILGGELSSGEKAAGMFADGAVEPGTVGFDDALGAAGYAEPDTQPMVLVARSSSWSEADVHEQLPLAAESLNLSLILSPAFGRTAASTTAQPAAEADRDVASLPTERSNLPTERSNLPTERSNLPTERSNLPTERSNLPTERSNLPNIIPAEPAHPPVAQVSLAADRPLTDWLLALHEEIDFIVVPIAPGSAGPSSAGPSSAELPSTSLAIPELPATGRRAQAESLQAAAGEPEMRGLRDSRSEATDQELSAVRPAPARNARQIVLLISGAEAQQILNRLSTATAADQPDTVQAPPAVWRGDTPTAEQRVILILEQPL